MNPTPIARAVAALLVLAGLVLVAQPAHAAATRHRSGATADASRPNWSGPAFTMNGSGAVVPSTMTRAVDAIRGGTGSLDVVVLAGSAPESGSVTPECDAVVKLTGVNSCTTWILDEARDGDDSRVNADIRAAEFVYFAGGDQCRYTDWKGTALETSVESVVAKGGGAGGGSAGHHINSSIVYDACEGGATSESALADPYESAMTFTTGMFSWPHYQGTINDSHFVTRDRMGRTMAFVARAIADGATTDGRAWGVGVDDGGSIHIDGSGIGTVAGADAYVVLGDHEPERAEAGRPLTFSGYKIWKLAPGATFDFRNRPSCGYYLRSVTDGTPDADLYGGSTAAPCPTTG